MPQVDFSENLQRELADSIIRSASLDDIRILLACGARVSEPVTQGLRPLHYAVYQRYLEAIHLLVVRGCDVNARDDVGYSALHLCAEHGHVDIMRLLIGHDARVDWSDRDSTVPYPNTVLADQPLRLAIKNGHYDAAKLLLENGANPNARYFLGSEINFVHPLNYEFLELLLAFGADPNARDRSSLTPLMKACRHPDGMQSILLLISHGADVNAMTSERHDFRTVLHYAVLSGDLHIVNLLLKQGATVTYGPDYRKPTPLDFAILKGSPEMVKMLLDAGANVNANSPLIGSPLHVACTDNIENRFELLQLLLDRGADPNRHTVTEMGGPLLKPPLGEYIHFNGNPELKVLGALLKYGAVVVLKTQYHDPRGILKCLPRLAQRFPHILDAVMEAAESFHVASIRRLNSVSPEWKQWLIDVAQTPLSLKHQLRLFFRRRLSASISATAATGGGGSQLIDVDQCTSSDDDDRAVTGVVTLPQRIQRLPLPPLIKMYLTYEV